MADWASTEFVQKHIDASCAHIVSIHREFSLRWYSSCSLESPLEAVFEIWWRALTATGEIDGNTVCLKAQEEVQTSAKRRYRVDFLVYPAQPMFSRAIAAGVKVPQICVELDGHEFHERTKEQVNYRNERDRDLQADGWMVLHFSGSELHRDPWKCIRAVHGVGYEAFSWDLEVKVREAEAAALAQSGGQPSQED